MDATEAKDLIDETIERLEGENEEAEKAERARDKTFRERVSLAVGGFAVALAIVHMAASGAQRESVLKQIASSDSFAYMQAKILREIVLKTAIASNGAVDADKKAWIDEAAKLREPNDKGNSIPQLQEQGTKEHEEGMAAAKTGEAYEFAETGLQLAIVLLSIALIARSSMVAVTATIFALAGIGLALLTRFGFSLLG